MMNSNDFIKKPGRPAKTVYCLECEQRIDYCFCKKKYEIVHTVDHEEFRDKLNLMLQAGYELNQAIRQTLVEDKLFFTAHLMYIPRTKTK